MFVFGPKYTFQPGFFVWQHRNLRFLSLHVCYQKKHQQPENLQQQMLRPRHNFFTILNLSRCHLILDTRIYSPCSARHAQGTPPPGLIHFFEINNIHNKEFLAALSSSRSVVVGRSVGRSVGPLVGHLCEKVTFRVLNCNLNLPTYLPMQH